MLLELFERKIFKDEHNVGVGKDSLWFETPGDRKKIKVAYSSCLGEFSCNKTKFSEICCHCQNLIIKNCFLA